MGQPAVTWPGYDPINKDDWMTFGKQLDANYQLVINPTTGMPTGIDFDPTDSKDRLGRGLQTKDIFDQIKLPPLPAAPNKTVIEMCEDECAAKLKKFQEECKMVRKRVELWFELQGCPVVVRQKYMKGPCRRRKRSGKPEKPCSCGG